MRDGNRNQADHRVGGVHDLVCRCPRGSRVRGGVVMSELPENLRGTGYLGSDPVTPIRVRSLLFRSRGVGSIVSNHGDGSVDVLWDTWLKPSLEDVTTLYEVKLT